MSTETTTIFKELTPIILDLDNIFLDPNNPRFTSMTWDEVSDNRIDDVDVQTIAQQKLIQDFSVDKLIVNIETNGFLPIDRVIVKEFKDGKYVVLEGNRRICATKLIKSKHEKNPEAVSGEVMESIAEINCLLYTGSEQQPSWIFQGLRHIMGIHDWSAFNKAKLLVKLMEDEDLNLTEVGKRFGLTAFGAGQWVRGYYAFRIATEESDYSREVDERAYPYFQELFSRSNGPFREWLQWNDKEYKFEDSLHFNEFLSWLYPRSEEQLDGSDVHGDWGQRKIARSNDIRMLSYLLREATVEFEAFRNEGQLEKAYNLANTKKYIRDSNPSEEAFNNISACIKSLENLPFKLIKNESEKLLDLLNSLEKAVGEIKEICQ
ncbi:hypothetical protein [Cellulosilyticum sp. WCF-2]|uniref:hypothetical protein n=1 Tax=Cellulosilyticum sp. WCF-2 TaxID=2497860 RepID=UPI000F8C8200|nr:hypothetical protein [Cellulosilyticum sp. WCF-2]QEH69366.1 hypothetical protein EKH84_13560 [Cellulosilyticum sp. WCF-2]